MRKVTITTSVIALFLITSGVSADQYPRNWDIDIVKYQFTLSLSDTTNTIYGSAKITAVMISDQTEIPLDLISANGSGTGMNVTEVTSEGQSLRFTHINDRLIVHSNNVFGGSDTVRFEILYEGVPEDGLIISRNKFGDRTFFGDNWPDRARNWLPTVDHPSDKALVDFTVICPSQYKVVANGRLIYEFVDERWDQRFAYWSQSIPISTKLMVIGVAPFEIERLGTVRDVPIEAWVFPQNAEQGFRSYASAVETTSYFDSLIGPFPYEKLANVQSKTRYGGMENASNIFYSERSVDDYDNVDELVAHEVAHQWFGNSASEKDWHHVWLSEGFATYFTRIYIQKYKGQAAMRDKLREDRQEVLDFNRYSPLPIVNPQVKDFDKLLNANSYEKGSWVLHMLRYHVGDEAFFEGIRSYYAEYRDRSVLTEDFQRHMEESSNMDLDAFFKQWVYDATIPRLGLDWNYVTREKQLTLTVVQLQKKHMDFNIEIAVDDDVYEIPINELSTTLTIRRAAPPSNVVFDPGVKLLYYPEER